MFWIVTFLAFAAFPMVAMADTATITFNNDLTGANSGGVYTGIYAGTLNGTVPANFICDDFNDEIGGGQSWTATVGGDNPVTTGMFGSSVLALGLNQQEDYNAVTYLAEQIFANPNSPNVSDLSWAIWSLNSTSAYNTNGYGWDNPEVQSLITAAIGHDTTNNGNLIVYTPTVNGNGQEFLAQGTPTATPEPSSFCLLATAAVLFSMTDLLGRIRRRQITQ